MTKLKGTLMPFLYPSLLRPPGHSKPFNPLSCLQQQHRRHNSTSASTSILHSSDYPLPRPLQPQTTPNPSPPQPSARPSSLSPHPSDYATTPFLDRCTLSLHSGSGGHGCVSFLREKYIADGHANGGDGGSGGSIYIQAVEGQTSLHKLARRGIIKAGRGKNGRGKSKGGERGDDVIVTVPVGTVIREIARLDPVAIAEEEQLRQAAESPVEGDNNTGNSRREKFILFPGSLPSELLTMDFPTLPRPRRSNLAALQPPGPISLDLDIPMEKPLLLAAGAMGGLGNPHFATKSITRPKYATKGEGGIRLTLELELKLLADVGLVGLPNAGKSTLLRSLSNSRARIGDWAFTTLQPNIGTVVLDNHHGRPLVETTTKRTNFTIADIPGLIEDAHLDKGLGLDFLRHIERARVLAFVIDLNAGDAVQQLRDLWREVGEYEVRKDGELNAETEDRIVDWKTFAHTTVSTIPADEEGGGDTTVVSPSPSRVLEPLRLPPVTSKPWFVVATKADLPETVENFRALKDYLDCLQRGDVDHPSGKANAWKRRLSAVPVSAVRGEGVQRIPRLVVDLLDE